MDTGATLGGIGLVFSIIGIIYSAVNHKHIRSKCCGRDIDISIDIDSTEAPEAKAPEAKVQGEQGPKVSKYNRRIFPTSDIDA